MPSNQELKQKYNCRILMTKALDQLAKGEIEQLELTSFERELLIQFEIPDKYVINWIKKFYLEPGILRLKEGVLYKN